jgi:hypothetical protein
MRNNRNTQFLNREFTNLDKPGQEYIENLANTLLLIQSSGEIEIRREGTKARINLKGEVINKHLWR